MSNPLRTPEDYELFIYSLPGQFKSIRQSTLHGPAGGFFGTGGW
jgi:hypothetical protein